MRKLPGVVALGVPTGDRIQVTANLEGETHPRAAHRGRRRARSGDRDGAVGLDARYID